MKTKQEVKQELLRQMELKYNTYSARKHRATTINNLMWVLGIDSNDLKLTPEKATFKWVEEERLKRIKLILERME